MAISINPPTDNLYKFIAIAGLIGAVVTAVLVIYTIEDTIDFQLGASDAFQVAWLEIGQYVEARDILEKYWAKSLRGEEVFGLTQEMRTIPDLKQTAMDAVREFEVKAETAVQRQNLMNTYHEQLTSLFISSNAVMFAGFIAWWFSTQRHQDAILRYQALQAKAKHQNSADEAPDASV